MNISHMKKLWLFTLLLTASGFLMAQTTIVQWDFNTASAFTVPANGTAPGPSLGSGTLNLIGGVSATAIVGFTNADPVIPKRSLSTTTYPGPSNNALTAGLYVIVNTTGYDNIHLTYYSEHTQTAANKVVVQYLNSSGWQTISSFIVSTSSNTSNPTFYDINFSPVISVNNRDSVQFRIVTDFANGTSYLPTNTNSNYAPSGAIHYDLVTVTGRPLSCGTLATQQATGLRLLKTDATSAQLTLNRGNGRGCIVLCSSTGVPTAPTNGTNYLANSSFGLGSAVGNAFIVYHSQTNNPSTQYFDVNGLTAGNQYYLAVYEYSSTGYCYLSPAFTSSFYCSSTVLYPGDIQFVGYDNDASGNADDAFALTNLKDLKPGTSFQIVNSRYEAGAAANERTQKWYSGGNAIYDNIDFINLLYTGTNPLSKGSIISFDFASPGTNIRINNTLSNDFSLTSNISTGNSILSTNPEQFFLTQGRFTNYLTRNLNQYYLLDGHVLHGISYRSLWVPFNQPCGSSTTRESRIPPDISCLNLFFSIDDYAYFKTSPSLHSGSQGSLLSNINVLGNWINSTSPSTTNNISFIYNSPFTVTSTPTTANWIGGNGNNWFNCSNWENLYVPDSTADVAVATPPVADINVNGLLAAEYSNLATTRNLNITGAVNLSGTFADKLIVYDVLQTGSTGSLTTSGSAIDTVVVRGSIQSGNSNDLRLSINGWLALHGNRQLQPINVSLASATVPVSISALSLNNPPGININRGGFESLQKLDLANGILSPDTTTAFHYMGAACTINSPVNYYGETNKGWEKSYIDSRVFIRTNTANAYTAPLGSKQKGVFAPMILQPQTGGATYQAGYIGMSHPNTSPADINTPPVTKVSTQEYWTLVSNPINAAASLILYYTPLSFVGGPQGTDPQALTDLKIVQYWDSSAGSPRKWRYPTFPISFSAGPTVQYGKISMGQYATSLREEDKNFTLGSGQGINTLPIKITAWLARLQGSRTQLTWQVQQETGTAFYVVEKSPDGKTFYPLQTVYASGLPAYACYDNTPADGWNYYRLKITDLSGKASYTTIEKVWLKHAATFTVFPNPALEKVLINLPFTSKGTLNLYAPDGRKCMTQTVANTSFTQLTVKGLPTGWYLLEYTDGKNRLTQKLMIK